MFQQQSDRQIQKTIYNIMKKKYSTVIKIIKKIKVIKNKRWKNCANNSRDMGNDMGNLEGVTGGNDLHNLNLSHVLSMNLCANNEQHAQR